jgi:isochorismatase family protein
MIAVGVGSVLAARKHEYVLCRPRHWLQREGDRMEPAIQNPFRDVSADSSPLQLKEDRTALLVVEGTGIGLDDLLRNAGIRTVILAGISFDGAIEGSVRSLTDRGYGLFLVPDACATFDERLQKGLSGMQTGVINVTSTAEIVARLGSARVVKSAAPG